MTYKVEGFLDKNNDLLYRDLSQAMYACKHSLLKKLFPEGKFENERQPDPTSHHRPLAGYGLPPPPPGGIL